MSFDRGSSGRVGAWLASQATNSSMVARLNAARWIGSIASACVRCALGCEAGRTGDAPHLGGIGRSTTQQRHRGRAMKPSRLVAMKTEQVGGMEWTADEQLRDGA